MSRILTVPRNSKKRPYCEALRGILGRGIHIETNGVEFFQAPTDRFYGIEALFKDNSGNWFRMTNATGRGGSDSAYGQDHQVICPRAWRDRRGLHWQAPRYPTGNCEYASLDG